MGKYASVMLPPFMILIIPSALRLCYQPLPSKKELDTASVVDEHVDS